MYLRKVSAGLRVVTGKTPQSFRLIRWPGRRHVEAGPPLALRSADFLDRCPTISRREDPASRGLVRSVRGSAVPLTVMLASALFLVLPPARAVAEADPGRVLPEGQLPEDRRLGDLKDLNGSFPFHVPVTPEDWSQRAEALRRRVLVATGLWPLPTRTPLNAVVHGLVRRDGFTVERVYFESIPDHFVTGLLFRPQDGQGKRPAVLCPHGHGGRLQDYGPKAIRELIAQGAERFEDCGRYPKLSRCAQLARMGCVTFIYDMIGYADSTQLSNELAHRFATGPVRDAPDRWGFYSTQAELRLQSILGLQTWNSIRALDFLTSLPDVDTERVGVTGGSGGGTQTILLGAIDPRPIVTFPQGMVSTSMQGGCTCENSSLLRIGTGNVELAALFAPKPQAMTAADDWTREMMTEGYPQLQQLYQMLGAADHVFCTSLTHFPHNYNYVTRALMYQWFNKHLKLGWEEPIVEEHWEPLTAEEWTVWNDEHPRPKADAAYQYQLTGWLAQDADDQLQQITPRDPATWQKFRQLVGGAFATLLEREMPDAGSIRRQKVDKQRWEDVLFFKDVLRYPRYGEELPILSFYPSAKPWNQQVVIWVDGRGKAGVFSGEGQLIQPVRQLLQSGFAVVSADLLYQGEFLRPGDALRQMPVVENPRQFAGFTFGYNHCVFAQRVHDILTIVAFVRGDTHAPQQVHLVGAHGAGALAAAARLHAGAAIDRAAIDTAGFRFQDLRSYRDARFLPGAVKYGDLPAMLALSAPHPLWVTGEPEALPEVVVGAYQCSGGGGALVADHGREGDRLLAAVQWLSEP